MTGGRDLRFVILIIVAAGILLPIGAGLWHTGRAAFGILPEIGAQDPSLGPWRTLFESPAFLTGFLLTLRTGLIATVLSLIVAAAAVATLHQRHLSSRGWARLVAPLLAAPHAALAIGLAFLIAPSGWIARLLSPWATGWTQPPDVTVIGDAFGLSLIFGLMMKEVPFLIFVILGALGRIPVTGQIATSRSLGYSPAAAWARVILPQVYPLIRVPVFIVLSYALTSVDMGIILGPSTPPTLAVQMTRWVQMPDLTLILPASAAGILLAVMVAALIGAWVLGEKVVRRAWRIVIRAGGRPAHAPWMSAAAALFWVLVPTGLASLGLLLVWSLALRWRFPDALPSAWSLQVLSGGASGLPGAALTTLGIGLAATGLSMTLAIAWLETEHRGGNLRARWAESLICLPLIVPQMAFLHGMHQVQLGAGIASTLPAVVWAHVLFVFPYVMLVLADPWRAVDPRLLRTAASVGAGPWRRLWSVRLPVLTAPLLAAAAIGFAVSVAQYLPTLFAGGGRVATLTTEAVALSSGSDRRVTAAYGLVQALLPMAAYALALTLPRLTHRNRRGLTGGFAR